MHVPTRTHPHAHTHTGTSLPPPHSTPSTPPPPHTHTRTRARAGSVSVRSQTRPVGVELHVPLKGSVLGKTAVFIIATGLRVWRTTKTPTTEVVPHVAVPHPPSSSACGWLVWQTTGASITRRLVICWPVVWRTKQGRQSAYVSVPMS